MRRLLLLIAALLCMASTPAGSPVFDTHLKEVRSYIDYFHRNTGRAMARKARFARETIAPVVVRESIARGVDPLLTSVIISLESSWNVGSSGGLGELGLMQVMNPRITPRSFTDEIMLGTEILQAAIKTCQDTREALTWYASGSCKPRTELTRRKMAYRHRLYQNAVERVRE